MSTFKLQNPSSWTMFIFGVLAVLLGVVGLIQPEATLDLLSFERLARDTRATGDYTLMFITASSMASFNMGVYYVLAALNNLQKFYRWTVPFRVLTFTVFMLAVMRDIAPTGFIGVAVWELLGAIVTGAALWFESRKQASA